MDLELLVYVLGLAGSSFPVKLQSSKKVSDLKKAIKEEKKKRLGHIDADELTLFKVSIPADDETLEQEARLAIQNAPKLNVSAHVISKVFRSQSERRILALSLLFPMVFG